MLWDEEGAAVLSIHFPPPYGGGAGKEALGKRLLIRGARPIGNLQVSAVPIQEGVVHLAFLYRPAGEVVGGIKRGGTHRFESHLHLLDLRRAEHPAV